MRCTIHFGGFNDSMHGARIEDMVESYFRQSDGELPDDFGAYDINWNALRDAYASFYLDHFSDYVKNQLGVSMTMSDMSINYPREYNFETDTITVDIPNDQVKSFNQAVKDKFPQEFSEEIESVSSIASGYIPLYSMDRIINDDRKLQQVTLSIVAREFNETELESIWDIQRGEEKIQQIADWYKTPLDQDKSPKI